MNSDTGESRSVPFPSDDQAKPTVSTNPGTSTNPAESRELSANSARRELETTSSFPLSAPIANIVDAFGFEGVRKLYSFLHNENDPFAWVMAFKNEKGKSIYARSKKLSARDGIERSINSIRGRIDAEWKVAFIPYPKNNSGESRWAGMDFDAHDGNLERPRALAMAALEHFHRAKPDLYYILERTATGGWHLWIIDKQFVTLRAWVELLQAAAVAIGTKVIPGICEIFPNEPIGKGPFGHGLQAPGAIHPRTGTSGEICFHNVTSLIACLRITSVPAVGSFPKIDRCFFFEEEKEGKVKNGKVIFAPILEEEKKISYSLAGEKEVRSDEEERLARNFEAVWAAKYSIDQPNMRNERVKTLVGHLYFQVSEAIARRIVTLQFESKKVGVQASLDDHLADFESLWTTYEKTVWTPQLSAVDAQALNKLSTDTDRSAFRIFYGYRLFAEKSRKQDFPIVRNNLALRLGMTGQGAGKLIARFARAGILQRTEEYIPQVSAAHYRWAVIESTDPGPPAAEVSSLPCEHQKNHAPNPSAADAPFGDDPRVEDLAPSPPPGENIRCQLEQSKQCTPASVAEVPKILPSQPGLGAWATGKLASMRASRPSEDSNPPISHQVEIPAPAQPVCDAAAEKAVTKEAHFERQVLAHLSVEGSLSANELRALVNGASEHEEHYGSVLKALNLRLIIDVDKSGKYQLAPVRENRKLFVAMNCVLDIFRTGCRLRESEHLWYELSFVFGIDQETLKKAVVRLVEAGHVTKEGGDKFRITNKEQWEGRRKGMS